MRKMNKFVTEFGHEIPLVQGYLESCGDFALNYYKQQDYDHGLVKADNKPMDFGLPGKDWVNVSAMIHFMSRFGLLKKREKAIDLGGAEGTAMRLFKAAGIVEEATSVDIEDFSAQTGDGFFEDFIAFITNMNIYPGVNADRIRASISQSKHIFDHFADQPLESGLYVNFPNPPELDHDLHMSALEVTGKYDFVTVFSCFEYFDLDVALSKVREILNPGGLFVLQGEYWWWAVNSTGILGHFPYAGQRLSFSDLERYASEHQPELLDAIQTKYHFYHQGKYRPTITDWFGLARKHGLRPVAVHRAQAKQHHRLNLCPPTLFKMPWFDHREILRDIHYLNPSVTVEDLLTSAFYIAMEPA